MKINILHMKKNKNSLVWQITEGGQNPSYILGTMHVRDARAFQFEHLFYEKILNCTAFATEFNLNDMQTQTDFTLSLPNGLQLQNIINPKAFAKIFIIGIYFNRLRVAKKTKRLFIFGRGWK